GFAGLTTFLTGAATFHRLHPFLRIARRADMSNDSQTHRTATPQEQDAKTSGSSHSGAHQATPDDPVQSRSADPGQSSYGGFKDQDPSRQAQQLDDQKAQGDEIASAIAGNTGTESKKK